MIGLDAVRYAGANARVKGLQSRLLSAETWKALVSADNLGDAFDLLRASHYASETDAGAGARLSLESVERRLLGRAAANLRKSMAFVSGASRQLLVVWWQHFELENLKAVFRGVNQGMSPDRIQLFLIPLGGYSTLPWDALLHEHSVPGLIERLNKSHYINPLRNAYHMYERDRSLFGLEVALDVRYYRDVAAAINKLGPSERAEARRVLGTYLDILNMLWAFRYRVYYGLSAEEIVNYTLWHTIHTDADLVRTIALGATPGDIVTQIWGPHAVDLSPLQDARAEPEMLPRLEAALMRYWRGLAAQQTHGYPFRLGAILGYLILEELETQDIVRILEGKMIGWDVERIREHLVRVED